MINFKFKNLLKWLIPFIMLVILLFILPVFFIEKERDIVLSTYKMDLVYDENSHTLVGKENVVYYNNSENMFTHLYFHLYPNAFREGAKAKVVASTNKTAAYPNGDSYGHIDIVDVLGENGKLNFEIIGEDQNILSVELDQPVYPDECVIVKINFITTLANVNHRLGYGGSTSNFGNFYPIACVYEDGIGFCQSLYHSNGDPFYSDCSNYEVSIEFNSKYSIASSGNLKSSSTKEKTTINKYKAEQIRDFCFVLSDKFEMVSQKVEGIEINYYGYQGDKNLSKCLDTAVESVLCFSDMFGLYPYKQLSVVKSNFIHGGMEYPNLVLISDDVLDADQDYVIVHEIAHQWWYGVVGNDQYNHAWQDEGLAEFSTMLFFKTHPERADFDELINGANNSYKLFEEVYTRIQGQVDGRMDRPICDFQTEPEYVQCTYTKGVLLFHNIYQLIGDKKFEKSLRVYYENFKFKNARPEELIAEFVKVGGGKIENLFDTWLRGKVVFK